MKLLNLGCGTRYHQAWTNLDFVSSNENVISHNLLQGIPFTDNSFDVVYHSHVLEHFSRSDGRKFIEECFRVLKPNGIFRIAVPNLERIVREYLKNLELALQGNENAANNYDWIKLELYDQVVRNESGGDMAKYLFQQHIPNEEYVFERIGEEGRNLRKAHFHNIHQRESVNEAWQKNNKISIQAKLIIRNTRLTIKKIFFKKQIKEFEKLQKEVAIGRFRLGGEIHQWMYDRYSLTRLLAETGFIHIEVKDAFSSGIPGWNEYELEAKSGTIFKPDSLFMEAVK